MSRVFQSKRFLNAFHPVRNKNLANCNLHPFDLEDIKTSTKNFSDDLIISEDMSGKNFIGHFDGNIRLVIKVLNLDAIQGSEDEWVADVTHLGKLRHRHLLTLVGYCCKDDHRILLYEPMFGKSLRSQLFENGDFGSLSWTQRLRVARGVAKGLAFLLGTDKPSIAINCSNTSNIIVDYSRKYKSRLILSDPAKEGLAGHEMPQVTTPPKIGIEGHDHVVTEVLYRYGVVLLELLTGLPSTSIQNSTNSLIKWHGRELKTPKDIIEVMDKRLEGEYSKSSARMATSLAYKCLGQDASERHTIDSVLEVMKLLKEFDLAFAAENPTHSEHHGEVKSKGDGKLLKMLYGRDI